jgi:DNA-binding MarR family transcriptional regulator
MAADISDIVKEAVSTRLLHSYQALLVIMHSKHGIGYQPSELSRMTGMSLAAIGYAKRELLAGGLAEERHPYRDRRGVRIYLTDEGKKEAALLWTAIEKLASVAAPYYVRKP